MYDINTQNKRTQLVHNERAWEGHVAGRHWTARVVNIEESTGFCGLFVATGAERDENPTQPNCLWDYVYDHFVGRFGAGAVPVGVTQEMLSSLHEWLENFQSKQNNFVS